MKKEEARCKCGSANIEFSWFNLYNFAHNIMSMKCLDCGEKWDQEIKNETDNKN